MLKRNHKKGSETENNLIKIQFFKFCNRSARYANYSLKIKGNEKLISENKFLKNNIDMKPISRDPIQLILKE